MIEITQEEVIKNWGVNNTGTPLVSIRCITYNHEKFISQALDSFLMQKTTFPFEVVVHDDASTDNTANIIREYEKKFPKIIKPIYETENQYSKPGNPLGKIVDAACKGKYIAFCEGDDYWIDDCKLQKQVNVLENDSECGLCYTKAKCFSQRKNKFTKELLGFQVDGFKDLLLNGNRIPTLTVVARRSLLEKYVQEINPNEKKWKMGDYPKWLYISHESKIRFIDKVTSSYRVLENSASHSNNMERRIAFEKSVYEIRHFFSEKYGITIEVYDENKELFYRYYFELTKKYDLALSKKMNSLYKEILHKNIKLTIINLFSKNILLFNIFLYLKNKKKDI